ncbi:unnamed protein product [Arabidopsis arenosa]|uniref:NYN domain-containing protein n=1 Tax=Arabidopsis arenosa TaxID=38785 RepID=A0A8S1ZCF1_ARAAE|nr:unnamed protein product [Arabidopsis arenosa]
MMERPTTIEVAEAAIAVYWDMKMCPVPDGYDARRVGPFIEWNLRQLGYTGPITITAVGLLSDVPEQILEALFSSGVSLSNVPYGTRDVATLVLFRTFDLPPPASFMVISHPEDAALFLDLVSERGYNPIFPFPLKEAAAHLEDDDGKPLWENFLRAEPPEEDKCSETGQSWVCRVCHGVTGRDFQSFITHLSTPKHIWEFPRWHTYATSGNQIP